MLYAGLDLSRKRLDFCLLDQLGEKVEVGAAPPDADGLRGLAARIGRFREPVVAAIESMNGARFVHDQLEQAGWDVAIADAVKVKGLAPLACKTDRIDAWVLAELARRDLVPAIWLPDPESGPSANAHASDSTSSATAPLSSSASTPSCSPTANPVRSPTSSASRAATCSNG
jgi:transposase